MNRWVRLAIALLAGLFAVGGVWIVGPSPRVRLSGGKLMASLFSPDARWLVIEEWTRSNDRIQNLVVDTATGEARLQFPGRRLHALAFSPDGRLLARAADYSDSENGIDVWDLETGAEVERLCWRVLPAQLNSNLPACTLAFSPEGKLLLGSVERGVWDVAARTRIADLKPLIPAGPMPARPHYLDLIGFHEERRVRLVSLKTGVVTSEFVLPGALRNYRWSAGGRYLAADFYDMPGIHVADGQTGTWVPMDRREDGMVESIAEAPPLLTVTSSVEWGHGWLRWLLKEPPQHRVVRLFDVTTGNLVDEVSGNSPLLSPDGTTLAVQTQTGALELWDLPRPTPWLRCCGAGLLALGVVLLGQIAWTRRSKRARAA